MIYFLKITVLAAFFVIQLEQINASNVTWEIVPEPLVFDKEVGIRCMYHNSLSCTDKIIWIWTIGTQNKLIMINGTLSEKYKYGKKYSEIRSSCSQFSTLSISNFSDSDFREVYTCSIANVNDTESFFEEYSSVKISFDNVSYEYIPAEELIFPELTIRNQQISFRLEIGKIYPVPACRATFADYDLTDELKVQKTDTGLFYKLVLTATIYNTSMAAFCDLCIICYGNWRQLGNYHPFCSGKLLTFASDSSTEDTSDHKSPTIGLSTEYTSVNHTSSIQDFTTEDMLVHASSSKYFSTKDTKIYTSSAKTLTTDDALGDISSAKDYFLAVIVFVGVFCILYPVNVLVSMKYWYFRKKDSHKQRRVQLFVDKILNVFMGSCCMIAFLILGIGNVTVRHPIPDELAAWMNFFSVLPLVSNIFYCVFVCGYTVKKIRKITKHCHWGSILVMHVTYGLLLVIYSLYNIWLWIRPDVAEPDKTYSGVFFVFSTSTNVAFLIPVFIFHSMEYVRKLWNVDRRPNRRRNFHSVLNGHKVKKRRRDETDHYNPGIRLSTLKGRSQTESSFSTGIRQQTMESGSQTESLFSTGIRQQTMEGRSQTASSLSTDSYSTAVDYEIEIPLMILGHHKSPPGF